MNFPKHAYLLRVIKTLDNAQVPTDKPHLHKTVFLIEAATSSKVPFEFVYNNGPHSYDIDAELAQMRNYAAIVSVPIQGTGVVYCPDRNAPFVEAKHQIDPADAHKIGLVCDFVASMGKPPIELDRQATVAWIMRRELVADKEGVVERFRSLKPNTSRQEIEQAIAQVDTLFAANPALPAKP